MKCATYGCNGMATKTVMFEGVYGDKANIPVCSGCSYKSYFDKFDKIDGIIKASKNGGIS